MDLSSVSSSFPFTSSSFPSSSAAVSVLGKDSAFVVVSSAARPVLSSSSTSLTPSVTNLISTLPSLRTSSSLSAHAVEVVCGSPSSSLLLSSSSSSSLLALFFFFPRSCSSVVSGSVELIRRLRRVGAFEVAEQELKLNKKKKREI